jgi:gamma-glutamylputrescine oxidase
VVGGGYAGLSAALELAARGYAVILLEAQRLGWGASGRNGGQVIAGFGFAGEDTIEAQWPPEDARRAWDISVESLQLLQQRIRTHAIDCEFVNGYLYLAVNASRAKALAQRVTHVATAFGYPMQTIPAEEIGAWICSDRFYAGAFDAQSGHLHPLKYCLGLAQAARAAQARIFESSPVVHLQRGARPVVKTANGEVACDFVVLAGNVYLGEYGPTVAPELGKRIMPVGTYIIATEPMARARADRLIRHRAAVSDTNHLLDYFRLTPDSRLLFGGGESYSTSTPRDLTQRLRRRMLRVFPQLEDLRVEHAWGGFVDITMNQAPDFGRLGQNVYYLQGFSGHGVSMAGMAGKLAAQAIAGQAERFDLFARIRHRALPGGAWVRTPALALGMLYYQLLDLLS